VRLNIKLRKNLHPIPTPSFAALAYCIQSSCWILKHNWAVEGNKFDALLTVIQQGVGKIQFGLEAVIEVVKAIVITPLANLLPF